MLAPIALVLAFAAVIVVAGTSNRGSHGASDKAVTAKTRPRPAGPRTYKIRPGDSLTIISDRTHVLITTITRLNPGLDPSVIIPGRRIKLR